MNRIKRIAIQAAITLTAITTIVAVGTAGLRGLPLVLVAVVLTTIAYTAMDALQPTGKPHDGTWVRRKVTSNLIYTTIAVTILIMVMGIPMTSKPGGDARHDAGSVNRTAEGKN